MTALTELKEIVNIENLQSAYYQDKFKLNLEETLNLLDKIEIEHMITELTFYGKGFKIMKITLILSMYLQKLPKLKQNILHSHYGNLI